MLSDYVVYLSPCSNFVTLSSGDSVVLVSSSNLQPPTSNYTVALLKKKKILENINIDCSL
jgi:hypothetical protein